MSLDDRLRSGLKTLADQTDNTELQLAAFRRGAYARRARRRVFEGIGAVAVATAIAVGATAVVRNIASKPAGYVERPKGMPTCTNDNLHRVGSYGAGPRSVLESGFTAVRTPCWVDDVLRLTITDNGMTSQFNVAPLPIQGNGSTIRLRGVVPLRPEGNLVGAVDVLGVGWEWTNWCGAITRPFFEIKALSGNTDLGELDNVPSNATCTDRSKPSVLRPLGQVTEIVVGSPSPS